VVVKGENSMPKENLLRGIFPTDIPTLIDNFLIDRKAQRLSPGTLRFYKRKLNYFTQYCQEHQLVRIDDLNPNILREFMLEIEDKHNPGGAHAVYRSLKVFLLWYENDAEPENWKNPIRKVKAPKVDLEPLDPVSPEDVYALIEVCSKNFTGIRDKAILLGLLSTGARACEFLNLDLRDINLITGDVIIRKGKGGKFRHVKFNQKACRAIKAYLRQRNDDLPALWITDDRLGRIHYDSLRWIVARRAEEAKIKAPSIHSFRRAFAIAMLRGGTDLITLAHMMGHTSLGVTRRYLKIAGIDVEVAYARSFSEGV
jgi:site-specific recombinase XerD